jgi:tRNA pseudouridine55 synthase
MLGAVIIDKQQGWTSHDVVGKVRRLLREKKVGHLGTLDPMATGVLPLLVGGATRLAKFFVRDDKIYEGIIRFGYSTDSYDADGRPTSPVTDPVIEPGELDRVFEAFRGAIRQTPPPISAKKIAGKPAYLLARQNKPVDLKPVEVTVKSLEILACAGAEATIRVHCTAGTYVRAIAHEAGQALGCGAHLKTLRRLASGGFGIDQAVTIERLAGLAAEDRAGEVLIRAVELLPEFPTEVVDPLTASQIRQGRDFRDSPFRARHGSRYVKAVTASGELVAIGEAKLPNVYHPAVVL